MLNKAKAFAQAGQLDKAAQLYAKLLGDKPRNAAVLRSAILFHNRYTRKFRHAVPMIETLLKLKPNDPQTHILATETYCNCARPHLARPHANQALTLAPRNPEALFIAAVTAMQRNRFDQALGYLDTALDIAPDFAPALLQKGRALRDLGQQDAAHKIASELLAQNPQDQNALELYIQTTRVTTDDPVWRRLIAGDTPLDPALTAQLMAKGYGDLGQDTARFDAATQAKRLSSARHDSAAYTQFVSTQSARVTATRYTGMGNPSRQPLLIVGMPRSGSTLLETFLLGHSQINSAGESPSLNVILQDIGVAKHDGAALAQAITQIPDEAVTRFAARYLSETAQDTDTPHTIDKSLHNYELLGFFARLFPKAPIIHMARDPLDTCVSCILQPLSAWHSYTHDQTDLGRYYIQYRRLMTHWAATLPNPMHQISYEDLTHDPEATMRKAISFIGLDWEDTAADHLSHQSASKTLSFSQIRQPIYQTSKARWQKFDAQIGPLKAALAPLYPHGFTPIDGQ